MKSFVAPLFGFGLKHSIAIERKVNNILHLISEMPLTCNASICHELSLESDKILKLKIKLELTHFYIKF